MERSYAAAQIFEARDSSPGELTGLPVKTELTGISTHYQKRIEWEPGLSLLFN